VLEATHAFGAFIFAPAGGNRLYSRMFSLDIPEDPATGSPAGRLAPLPSSTGWCLGRRRSRSSASRGRGWAAELIHIELGYRGSEDIPERIEVGAR